MKLIFFIALLLTSLPLICQELKEDCYPDKGIKTAIVSGEIKYANTFKSEKLDGIQTVLFNKNGQPINIKKTREGESEFKRVYLDSKLQRIIGIRKKLPDFYRIEHLDSLIENAVDEIDTAIVVSHHNDGRPREIINPDGTTLIFDYFGCDGEVQTLLDQNRDTIHQFRLTNKDGVLVETIWTPFIPIKSIRSTKYFDYEFDEHGNWIQRSYKHEDNTIISETRRLTYHQKM